MKRSNTMRNKALEDSKNKALKQLADEIKELKELRLRIKEGRITGKDCAKVYKSLLRIDENYKGLVVTDSKGENNEK
tara:strand:+ start:160 stop:390 length:231 start_codon:yes stop_codon:yes gene_type:complete